MSGATLWPTLGSIVEAARARLDEAAWDFVVGGAESETTLLRNRLAFDRLALVPRVLRPLADDACRTKLFDFDLRLPVIAAPMGVGRHFGPRATAPLVEGARDAGTIATVSSVAAPSPRELRRLSDAPLFLQLYLLEGESDDLPALLDRCGAADFEALVVTLDTPIYGRRERDMRRGFSPSAGVAVPGRVIQPGLDWAALARLRDLWRGPLIAKGVASAEDAERLLELGVDALWVSNHGGRQLDQAEASLDILRRLAPLTRGRATVIFDGGALRGTDIVKALALGADVVACGKLLGLAASVQAVAPALDLLRDEVLATLRLMGTPLSDLEAEAVAPAEPVRPPRPLGSLAGASCA